MKSVGSIALYDRHTFVGNTVTTGLLCVLILVFGFGCSNHSDREKKQNIDSHPTTRSTIHCKSRDHHRETSTLLLTV